MKKTKNGFTLVMSVLILTSLLILGSYVISSSNSEFKIANANLIATKNYYLAEAGIKEMIWKIENNEATGDAFLAGNLSATYDIERIGVFGNNNANYHVTAISTAPTEAQIIATSTYQIAGNTSRRVVKSYVSQATGSTAEWDFSTFAGGRGSQQNGNFWFRGSGVVMTANGGRLHANQVFKIQGAELIVNDGVVSSSNVINIIDGGRLTLNNSYQDAPTSTVDMLQIDFDSDDLNSWKNRATQTYTENQFKNLPNGSTLNGIIYVTGDAKIIGKSLTINGVLVATDDIEITLSGQPVTVNYNETYGAGLLAKDDVNITTSGSTITIDGLVYAADDLAIVSSGSNFTINGSLTAFDAQITASGGGIVLNYTPSNFLAVIDPNVNPSSPIIQVDHWEEQY